LISRRLPVKSTPIGLRNRLSRAVFQPFVLVVVGLAFEARIAGTSKGTTICCRRGDAATYSMQEALANPACRGVISFGIAGGLDRRLRSGTHLVASEVITSDGSVRTHEGWSRTLLNSCDALHAPILGTDQVVIEPHEKHELFARTGAVAVDTESHIAALMARERGLPFACLRTVADPAHRRVPKAAMSGLRPDGRAYPVGVLRELFRRPHETAALLAIAHDTWRARRVLTRAIALAGDHLGFPHHHVETSVMEESFAELRVVGAP
jgi:adenosylhomocysteine nucleosidase